jgi:hypothetical protein
MSISLYRHLNPTCPFPAIMRSAARCHPSLRLWVAKALYMATMTDTPYLDHIHAPLCVLLPLHRASGCCGGHNCHHNSDVPLSPPFLNCLFQSFLSLLVLPCFTLSLPGSWRGLIAFCLAFPSSTDPHLSHTAIFPYHLGVVVHILIVYYIPH